MIRDRRLILIPLLMLLVFAGSFFIYKESRQANPPPAKKTVPNKIINQPSPEWYIKFSVKNQKTTAYTEAASAPVSSAGKEYYIGSGAVHPRYPLNAGGEARNPIIPFGTTLYLDEPIEILGQKHDTLVVNDTGDVYYGLWPSHPYWVDIYFGQTNYYNNKSASNAGVKLINYSWYEPWPSK